MGLAVVGAGFGRTGTKSLKLALNELGFGPCHHMFEIMEHPEQLPYWQAAARGETPDWDAVFANYGSCVDWPSARFWREIAAHYPDAKVLLSVRPVDLWIKSIHATILPALTDRSDQIPASPLARREMANEIVLEQTFGGRMGDAEHELMNLDPRRRSFSDRYFQPLLPWRDSEGRPASFDLRWIFPLASELNIVTPLGGLNLPFVFQQPFFTVSQEWRFNQDDYIGREIAKEEDTLPVRLWKWAVHAMKGVAPTPPLLAKRGGGGIQRIYNAATGEGHESVHRAILGGVVGIKIRDPWIPRDRAYQRILLRLGQGEADRFAELMTLWNDQYRGEFDRPIHPGRVLQSFLQKEHRRALDSRRIP